MQVQKWGVIVRKYSYKWFQRGWHTVAGLFKVPNNFSFDTRSRRNTLRAIGEDGFWSGLLRRLLPPNFQILFLSCLNKIYMLLIIWWYKKILEKLSNTVGNLTNDFLCTHRKEVLGWLRTFYQVDLRWFYSMSTYLLSLSH